MAMATPASTMATTIGSESKGVVVAPTGPTGASVAVGVASAGPDVAAAVPAAVASAREGALGAAVGPGAGVPPPDGVAAGPAVCPDAGLVADGVPRGVAVGPGPWVAAGVGVGRRAR
jgi:hypothetical protein